VVAADMHFVGKDILRFHAIYWPAFLMAAGLAPPRRVFAHGWWTNEGQKISKSLGNVIDPVALVGEFGLDPVRYFLLREVPFGQDGDFSRRALILRNNGELADALGNLANRTLSLIGRNCEGRLPEPTAAAEADREMVAGVAGLRDVVARHLDRQEFHLALEAIMAQVRAANGYITVQQPWALKKTDAVRMAAVLRHLHDALRTFATVLQPFMPGRWRSCWTSSACRRRRGASTTSRPHCPPGWPCRRRSRCSARSRPRRDRAMIVDSHCHLGPLRG
jgi:methionyl-tRNA synthetase